jgi:hypothetical protein
MFITRIAHFASRPARAPNAPRPLKQHNGNRLTTLNKVSTIHHHRTQPFQPWNKPKIRYFDKKENSAISTTRRK